MLLILPACLLVFAGLFGLIGYAIGYSMGRRSVHRENVIGFQVIPPTASQPRSDEFNITE